jgi:hypothetical protein
MVDDSQVGPLGEPAKKGTIFDQIVEHGISCASSTPTPLTARCPHPRRRRPTASRPFPRKPGDWTYDGSGATASGPSVLVSPYAKRRHVSHVVYDHTSVLAFVERKWNPSRSSRDYEAVVVRGHHRLARHSATVR